MDYKAHTPTEHQMQQTIDQLRANAKGHKKTVDKMSAKVSQLTEDARKLEYQRDRAISVAENAVEYAKKANEKWREIRLQAESARKDADFFKAQFEMHCTIDKSEFGNSHGWVLKSGRKPPRLRLCASAAFLFSFLVTAGVICAYGWFLALERLIN